MALCLCLCLSQPSLLIIPLCLHRADECIFPVSQHWCVYVSKDIEECHLWVSPYFSSSAKHVLIPWFIRWEVNGRTMTVPISKIPSKQRRIFFLLSSIYRLSLWISNPSHKLNTNSSKLLLFQYHTMIPSPELYIYMRLCVLRNPKCNGHLSWKWTQWPMIK